jgi:hypothetical protein
MIATGCGAVRMRRDAAAIGHLLEATFKVFLLANMFSFRNLSELHRVPSSAADKKLLFSYAPDWCVSPEASSLPRDYIQG